MTIRVKCLMANDQDIFCIHGKLFRLDPQGKSLRYLRPCSCVVCTKAAKSTCPSSEILRH